MITLSHTQTKTQTDVVLAVRNLKKSFPSKKGPPVHALRGVSLEARRRQVTGGICLLLFCCWPP